MTSPRPYPEFNREPKKTEYEFLPPETTLDSLVGRLSEYNIPLDEYGVDGAKTVHHLLDEINNGESVLKIGGNRVQREIEVLWLDVLHRVGENVYILKENRQEFKDGRVSHQDLESSIGKKIRKTENPEDMAFRALNRVLSIDEPDNVSHVGDKQRVYKPSDYPGITSTYNMHSFVATIPESEFNPEGYIEHLPNKDVYYKWELLNKPNEAKED